MDADLFDDADDDEQHPRDLFRLKPGPKLDLPPPETSVLFRLLSSPHKISLLPPPPPPPVTREPECEDDEAAAETRRQRAEAVAVDAAWVMKESAELRPPFRVGRVEHVHAELDSSPPMMLVHRLQKPRKTRPPVPRSQLRHHPYASGPVLPSAPRNIMSIEV